MKDLGDACDVALNSVLFDPFQLAAISNVRVWVGPTHTARVPAWVGVQATWTGAQTVKVASYSVQFDPFQLTAGVLAWVGVQAAWTGAQTGKVASYSVQFDPFQLAARIQCERVGGPHSAQVPAWVGYSSSLDRSPNM